ncbi:MAG: 4,5-DOPA dioxygenase extradiol [Acidimicrobiales bacterium]
MTHPAVFIGHGNPMYAVVPNRYAEAWAALGRELPRPSAVLSISAHWYVPGLAVTTMARPRTIHDFGGFPRELFEVSYPAPGDPGLAERVRSLLAPREVAPDTSWGLDHGTWSVLRHLYPEADVPVVQLSIDARQEPAYHAEVGRRLAPLRDEGVLIMGSGNVAHNQQLAQFGDAVPPSAWALRFEADVRARIEAGDDASLVSYPDLGEDARLAVPTPDHYYPLLYVLGARHPDEAARFPVEGIDASALSMLSTVLG